MASLSIAASNTLQSFLSRPQTFGTAVTLAPSTTHAAKRHPALPQVQSGSTGSPRFFSAIRSSFHSVTPKSTPTFYTRPNAFQHDEVSKLARDYKFQAATKPLNDTNSFVSGTRTTEDERNIRQMLDEAGFPHLADEIERVYSNKNLKAGKGLRKALEEDVKQMNMSLDQKSGTFNDPTGRSRSTNPDEVWDRVADIAGRLLAILAAAALKQMIIKVCRTRLEAKDGKD